MNKNIIALKQSSSIIYEKLKEISEHFQALTGVNCFPINELFKASYDISCDANLSCCKNSFCDKCPSTHCKMKNTLRYGMNEACRWAGKYVFYCPVGLVFIAASVSDDPNDGGLILGPMIIGEKEDTINDFPYASLESELNMLEEKSVDDVRHIAEVMVRLVKGSISEAKQENNGVVFNQEEYLNALYRARDMYRDFEDKANTDYEVLTEKLIECIRESDKKAAQEQLNLLLGNIYFDSDFKLDTIKYRMIEFILVLSSEAISEGADVAQMFSRNSVRIHEIEQLNSIDELSAWITEIVHSFMHIVFDFSEPKHSDMVHKLTGFIRANYNRHITLDDMSKEVGLSASYLSSVFKQETGVSISTYTNKVRVEHSKKLLKNTALTLSFIANECCFETQSYFNKVFKDLVGMTPGQYRNMK